MLLRTANCSTRNVADPECEDTVNLKHSTFTRSPSCLGGVVGIERFVYDNALLHPQVTSVVTSECRVVIHLYLHIP